MMGQIKLKLTKLDKRHNGRGMFTHRLEFEGGWKSRAVNFVRARNWLQEHFGHSSELHHVHAFDTQPLWAWDSEYGRRFLYLTGVALTQFVLIKDQFEKEIA